VKNPDADSVAKRKISRERIAAETGFVTILTNMFSSPMPATAAIETMTITPCALIITGKVIKEAGKIAASAGSPSRRRFSSGMGQTSTISRS
jgi:hypothetical protein